MKFRRPREDSLEINLTPLIDCLLFLIIFLMISTTFNKASKLQIVLPEAHGEAARPNRAKAIEVAVSQAGLYTINGQELAAKDARHLQSAIEKPAAAAVTCLLSLRRTARPRIRRWSRSWTLPDKWVLST